MDQQPVLPPTLARWIWWSAWCSLGSAAYAVYRGHTHLAISPVAVWLTSILYWWHPVAGWRRTLDIWVVRCALVWQLWYALWMTNGLLYVLISSKGILLCMIGYDFYNRGLYAASAIYHCCLHVLANVANIVLYLEDV